MKTFLFVELRSNLPLICLSVYSFFLISSSFIYSLLYASNKLRILQQPLQVKHNILTLVYGLLITFVNIKRKILPLELVILFLQETSVTRLPTAVCFSHGKLYFSREIGFTHGQKLFKYVPICVFLLFI